MAGAYFRAKAILDNGEHVYESDGEHVVRYQEGHRSSIEAIHTALRGRMDYAFCAELNQFRPAWCFPKGCASKKVLEFVFEDADDPLEPGAFFTSGAVIPLCKLPRGGASCDN